MAWSKSVPRVKHQDVLGRITKHGPQHTAQHLCICGLPWEGVHGEDMMENRAIPRSPNTQWYSDAVAIGPEK